jgi:hypothetical protein
VVQTSGNCHDLDEFSGKKTMTAIEETLYRDNTAHWVSGFEIAGNTIVITLHPSTRADLRTRATFSDATILSVDDSYADDAGRAFPWDIIGFDSDTVSPTFALAPLFPHF